MFTQRGGDTVLMERLAEGLRSLGVEVTLDAGGQQDPKNFDLVHLFNFALPDFTRLLAERAKAAQVPYVVTTLYEDIPNFHNQSIMVAEALAEYVRRTQDKNWWKSHDLNLAAVQSCAKFDNSWTAANAAALLSSGESESQTLRRDYPGTNNIVEIKFGCEIGSASDPELFRKKYGVTDFVLCVARIESRKNQLMLLKALEDSDLTVVLAGGGFTYQPAYEQAVRNFKRRGRTIVLDRVAPEMLASAYAAAKVHCLPSWYELPGLVSLEAAAIGCNVVASNGTIVDYLDSKIFYCDPWSESSIRNAVMAAFYAPVPAGLRESAQAFTWTETARKTLECYIKVAKPQTQEVGTSNTAAPTWQTTGQAAWAQQASNQSASVEPAIEFDAVLEKGEEAARQKDFANAESLLFQAQSMNPRSVRVLKALGAIALASENVPKAKDYFAKALEIDANEPRSLAGMGMCIMMEQDPARAYPYFAKAIVSAPDHMVTLLQLIEASYLVGRFDDLERALRIFVANNPNDIEMIYCHAGSLYKLGRADEAYPMVEKVLSHNPVHLGARQLREFIDEDRRKASVTPSATSSVTTSGVNNFAQPAQPAPTFHSGAATSLSSAVTKETTIAPLAATSISMPDSNDRALLEFEDLKRSKKFDEVKRGCQAVLARPTLRPDQQEKASLLIAEANVLTGELSTAAEIYEQILSKNPASARAMCGKGALAANGNDWNQAKSWFERALIAQSEYDVALAGLGLTAFYFKDYEKAWDCYSRALQSNPENNRALLGYLELGYSLKRFAEVEVALRNYLEVHPADLDFIYALAGCCFAQGRTEEALSEINKITLFDPAHQKANELREVITSGRSAEACATF